MPKIIKPRTLGFLSKTERLKVGASYIVTALGMFDLARPDERRFESEQALWLMAAKALPKGAVLDAATPKPCAELLVGGAARPVGGPASAMLVEWAVGPIHKRLVVSGDRNWRVVGSGAVATEPKPFTEMPIGPAQAFGGTGHVDNPNGKGFGALDKIRAGELAPLPNVELANQLVRSLADQPEPALVGPIDPASKKKLRYAGTYDSHWMKNVAPAMAEDVDPRFFLSAPEDQIFSGYLAGGEPYHLRGFSGDEAELRGALPAFRVRCFLARKGEKDGEGELVEIAMRTDTLWLVAGARRGVLIYRGALPVRDVDAEDISEVMLAYERGADEPRDFSHYVEVWKLRRDRKSAFKYAFAEGQLAPPLAPDLIARRNEARRALMKERLDRHREGQAWMLERQLDEAGVPLALRPASPSQEDDELSDVLQDFPVPTPEEIEESEIDLAAILDAIEALKKKVEETTDKLSSQAGAVRDSLAAVQAPGAGTDAVDGLFAALDEMIGAQTGKTTETAKALDDGFGRVEAPTIPAGAIETGAGSDTTTFIDEAKDWRQTLLERLQPPSADEEKSFDDARARFLDLPEGRMLFEARRALETAKGQELTVPDMGAVPDLGAAVAPAKGVSLDSLLDSVEREFSSAADSSEIGPASNLGEQRAKVEDQLRAAFPNLPQGEGSAIDALLAAVSGPTGGADLAARAAEAEAKGKEAIDQGLNRLDEQEARLAEGIATMRRTAPGPTYPLQPMTPATARRFGDFIVAQRRDGLSLRGRDLAGADLRNADLAGADLEGAFLERADLSGARLAGARLLEAALTGAILDGADLTDVDLTKANLSKCRAHGANFTRCRFSGPAVLEADFAGAKFQGASIEKWQVIQCNFDGADFSGAQLEAIQFIQTSFKESVWEKASLDTTVFMDLSLSDAKFRGARLFRCGFLKAAAPSADFEAADLTRTSFIGEIDLTNARLTAATGSDCTFHENKLSGANFEKAAFTRATFIRSEMTNARFTRASLKGALFGGATLKGADFVAANLLKAQLRKADLSGARLIGANLYAANLDHAQLATADLTGANLAKTQMAVDSNVL